MIIMNKIIRYVLVIAFFVGISWGISGRELVLPVLNNSDGAIYHGVLGREQVALTINVDWGEDYLPGILESLARKNVKATFFITGRWAEKNPDLLKKIEEMGHELGNHGFRHYHPKKLSNQGIIDLIKNNEEVIYSLTNRRTELFAPPYGEVDKRITEIAESIGYKTIMWSADTVDWQRPAPEIIVQRALNKIGDGGIILMHPTAPSLLALPEIIDGIRKKDYNFVTISQLIQR